MQQLHSESWAPTIDTLIELCEFEELKGECFLRGFGKQTGLWLDYHIFNPQISAKFKQESGLMQQPFQKTQFAM